MPSDHVHVWANASGHPLACVVDGCGVAWPGAPLPDSPNRREPAPEREPWGERVNRVLGELAELDGPPAPAREAAW